MTIQTTRHNPRLAPLPGGHGRGNGGSPSNQSAGQRARHETALRCSPANDVHDWRRRLGRRHRRRLVRLGDDSSPTSHPEKQSAFLAPIAGFYAVFGQMNMVAPGAATNVYGIKVRNVLQANELVHTQEAIYAAGGATNQLFSISGIINAALGDPIRLAAHQNSGVSQNCAGSANLQTRLMAYYLGP